MSLREDIAKAEWEMCAGCTGKEKIKWHYLKNPEARKAFYMKADCVLSLVKQEIEKCENPFPEWTDLSCQTRDPRWLLFEVGSNAQLQKIMEVLE
jgi:hypothetical protein